MSENKKPEAVEAAVTPTVSPLAAVDLDTALKNLEDDLKEGGKLEALGKAIEDGDRKAADEGARAPEMFEPIPSNPADAAGFRKIVDAHNPAVKTEPKKEDPDSASQP